MSFFADFKSEVKGVAFLAAALLLIVGVFGGVAMLQEYMHGNPRDEMPRQQSIDTSNWHTYRNDEYGFAIKHPAGTNFAPMGGNASFVLQGVEGGRIMIGAQDGFPLPYSTEEHDVRSEVKDVMFLSAPAKMRIVYVDNAPREVALYGFSKAPASRWNGDAELVLVVSDPSQGPLLEEILDTFRFLPPVDDGAA